jgi:hypothetical protein
MLEWVSCRVSRKIIEVISRTGASLDLSVSSMYVTCLQGRRRMREGPIHYSLEVQGSLWNGSCAWSVMKKIKGTHAPGQAWIYRCVVCQMFARLTTNERDPYIILLRQRLKTGHEVSFQRNRLSAFGTPYHGMYSIVRIAWLKLKR